MHGFSLVDPCDSLTPLRFLELGMPVFDRDVVAFDVALLSKASAEGIFEKQAARSGGFPLEQEPG
jgi:hypothetical protein